MKATTQRHKGKKAGFDTRISSPTSSSDFIIQPVVELDFLCRRIQRLKQRSLVPLGRNSHTRLHNECVCAPSTSARARSLPPSLPPSLACRIHVHTCAHSCFFFSFFFLRRRRSVQRMQTSSLALTRVLNTQARQLCRPHSETERGVWVTPPS